MINKKRQTDPGLDDGSTDSADEKGPIQSPISAASGCQHAKRAVDTAKLRKLLKTTGLVVECEMCAKASATSPTSETTENKLDESCNGFEYDNTLWLCLRCGTQLCGRSKNKHALKHFETPRSDIHALAMNTRSYEIWCYECDNEVSANSTKNLLECIEIVKKIAQKPPPIPNLENKILATFETLRPLVSADSTSTIIDNKKAGTAIPLPPPPMPGMAKRISDDFPGGFGNRNTIAPLIVTNTQAQLKADSNSQYLPRVRGLTNLGNTCFFNAVMQCLAQTPYLLEVLKESSEAGEEFILPGGTFKFKDDVNVELPQIKGTLSSWGGLTAALAQALEELQSGGGVFTPSKLFDKLCVKCPQFRGGDQHDSHELLRHLLESVRSEDLKRYQRVILSSLGYRDQQDINTVSDEMRQKCKIYGNQAADRILRPDQVFRGFLVSTLTCQDCFNVSSRHEYFLDLSLPVSVEKPPPPQRRKSSPDNEPNNSFYLHPAPIGPTKSQLKKEKEQERKAKRAAKRQNQKKTQKLQPTPDNATATTTEPTTNTINDDNSGANSQPSGELWGSSSTSSEQSDADVEDNLDDVTDKNIEKNKIIASDNSNNTSPAYDSNGNKQVLQSPIDPEKRGDSPENIDKDSLDEDENDSGIATSPANAGESFPPSSDTNGGGLGSDNNEMLETNNRVIEIGLSEKGANLVRQLSLGGGAGGGSGVVGGSDSKIQQSSANITNTFVNGEIKENTAAALETRLDKLQLSNEQKAARMRARRVRTQSYSDWSTTIAPRYHCEDGECSVQSCLNNFTTVELMSGTNKVGCDNCTKRINGDKPDAKTVNTDATKQFLISSPPAVLILHLKRFQLGPRCIFRKLTRAVDFPMVLDIAPFCGSKVKNLPNIDRKQKKLLYALYGVVEHTGGMYGGHYTAFVKVRPKLEKDDKRWKFIPQGSKAELDQDDEQRKKLEELLAKEKARDLRMKAADDSDDFSTSSSSSSEHEEPSTIEQADEASNVQVPQGKWYHVSDSRVQEANEAEVLRAQAYLLFYERIY